MSANKKDQNTATVEEVAKALGMRADFVAAAEMTPAEHGKALADFNKKRHFFLTATATLGAWLTAGATGLAIDLIPNQQSLLTPILMLAVTPAALYGTAINAARNHHIPCPRAEITTRAQANAMKAYTAMNAAAPITSP